MLDKFRKRQRWFFEIDNHGKVNYFQDMCYTGYRSGGYASKKAAKGDVIRVLGMMEHNLELRLERDQKVLNNVKIQLKSLET